MIVEYEAFGPENLKIILDKYPFLLDERLFKLKTVVKDFGLVYRLINTNFELTFNIYSKKIAWLVETKIAWFGETNYFLNFKSNNNTFSMPSSFEDVLENVPPEIGEKLLFHLDILR